MGVNRFNKWSVRTRSPSRDHQLIEACRLKLCPIKWVGFGFVIEYVRDKGYTWAWATSQLCERGQDCFSTLNIQSHLFLLLCHFGSVGIQAQRPRPLNDRPENLVEGYHRIAGRCITGNDWDIILRAISQTIFSASLQVQLIILQTINLLSWKCWSKWQPFHSHFQVFSHRKHSCSVISMKCNDVEI